MKNKTLLLLCLILGLTQRILAGPITENNPADTSYFHLDINWKQTNAISIKSSQAMETLNGKYVSVKEYQLTIPFFEEKLKAKISCENTPTIKAGNHIAPSVFPPPCSKHELLLYNDIVGGRQIGAIQNAMKLSVHDYEAAVGTNLLRAEAACRGKNYLVQYFRVIILKEKRPEVELSLFLNEKAVMQSSSNAIKEEHMRFGLNGKKTGCPNLFVRIVPPCGLDCRKTNFAVDELISQQTEGSKEFYTCDMNGLYDVKLIYQADCVGGGYINTAVDIPGWNHYSFLHADSKENSELAKQAPAESSDKVTFFPNPVKDMLTVQLPYRTGYSVSHITVTDMAGRQVLVQDTNSPRFLLNMSTLPQGAYIVQVIFDGKQFSEKIIHQ